jgi:hypothetical protein
MKNWFQAFAFIKLNLRRYASTINGRVAQIAFVAGLGAELSTGESFTSQFGAHVGAIVFASGKSPSFITRLSLRLPHPPAPSLLSSPRHQNTKE